MSLVIGTAGHIDHGKTTLLRALTGIDADRLPEERRRGMTIDLGYAHLTLDDGSVVDFVDVPGHDRLVGNMLVGAGEVDLALLVVAADDGPRAQTLEHLALLDALGVPPGIVAITKVDAVDAERVASVAAALDELLAGMSLAGSRVIAASGTTGAGIPALRDAVASLVRGHRPTARPPTLAIDRVFAVRGRGAVVTGTLRGGPLARGETLRLVPDGRMLRIREIQVHGTAVDVVDGGGRTALNLAGVDAGTLHRGQVLTGDPAVVATDRILARFHGRPADRTRGRFHAGTAAADAAIGRAGRDAIDLPDVTVAGIVRLGRPLALAPGDRFVLRRGPAHAPVGGVVLDVDPPRGIGRRRQTTGRVAAVAAGHPGARLELHGALVAGGRAELAEDVRTAAVEAASGSVPPEGARTSAVRGAIATTLRRVTGLGRDDAALAALHVVDSMVEAGSLTRDGDRLRPPGAAPPPSDPAVEAAMERLVSLLAVPTPPSLADAARRAGCPPAGVRRLEAAGRIVILAPDLAYATRTYEELAARALAMARREPLTPAAFRDATGTSRKYVMAILEDLDRRAILRRTPAGHVPGTRAPSTLGAAPLP